MFRPEIKEKFDGFQITFFFFLLFISIKDLKRKLFETRFFDIRKYNNISRTWARRAARERCGFTYILPQRERSNDPDI